jgi:hypothetical protein
MQAALLLLQFVHAGQQLRGIAFHGGQGQQFIGLLDQFFHGLLGLACLLLGLIGLGLVVFQRGHFLARGLLLRQQRRQLQVSLLRWRRRWL